jgi:hypothetical protein
VVKVSLCAHNGKRNLALEDFLRAKAESDANIPSLTVAK